MYRVLSPTAEIKVNQSVPRVRNRVERERVNRLVNMGKATRQGLFSQNITRLLADPKFSEVERIGYENGRIVLDTGNSSLLYIKVYPLL